MGNDFIAKTKKTFKKSWDNNLKRLKETNLLTQSPKNVVITIKVGPLENHVFVIGEQYIVEAIESGFDVYKNIQLVGRCKTPSLSTYSKVVAQGGKALGVVSRVYDLTGFADIIIN